MSSKALSALLLTALISLNVSVAHAATVSADAGIALGGTYLPSPPSVLSVAPDFADSDPGPDSANARVTDPRNEAEAHGVATTGGQLAANANWNGAQGQRAHVSATATWEEQFVATAGSSAEFSFHIPQALIGFGANNVRNLYGGFSVDISLNNSSVFSASASVLTTGAFPSTAADMPLVESGPLTWSFSSTDVEPGFGAGYVFDPFTGLLNLDPVDGDNTLSYTMTAFVIGLIGETSAIAYIGDPLSLSQSGGNSQLPGSTLTLSESISPVPVPGAVWLFATGVIGIFGLRRKLAS